MSRVFVVLSHVEVEPNNWSTEAIKVFASFDTASNFAKALKDYAEDNETIEIEELEYE
jgi:hypothetical protein